MTSKRYFVSGRVQGVFYRKSIQAMAQRERFSGYVRNLADGRVEAAVSAEDDDAFARFEALLRKGSSRSVVSEIIFETVAETFTGTFEVR